MFIVLGHSAVLENTTSQGSVYYLLHDVSDDFEHVLKPPELVYLRMFYISFSYNQNDY
jgi:hypothetical protein